MGGYVLCYVGRVSFWFAWIQYPVWPGRGVVALDFRLQTFRATLDESLCVIAFCCVCYVECLEPVSCVAGAWAGSSGLGIRNEVIRRAKLD